MNLNTQHAKFILERIFYTNPRQLIGSVSSPLGTAHSLGFTLLYREGLLAEQVHKLADVADAGDTQVHLKPPDPN